MTASSFQNVPVTCPNCKTRFATPILTIVDAGQDPEAKALFLSGQLNVAVCPNCGHGGMLSTPLVYHDAVKEMLFTFVPPELRLSEVEQQRVVGDLTNRVMMALPAEQRKGYLLRPRSFLRLEAMMEAILEGEGITREMLEAQRARAALLERLLRTPGEEARRAIAQENDATIDASFFELLTLNLQLAQAQGQEAALQQLAALRQQLLGWTTAGREVASREEAIRELGTQVTREELLDKLVAAALAGDQVKVETMVAVARPLVDYVFYQKLTEQIDAAEAGGEDGRATTFKNLRDQVLDLTAEIDAEIERLAAASSQLLNEILNSDDVEQAVRERLPQIDQVFMEMLGEQLRAATRAGETERADRLQQVGDTLLRIVEEGQPPQLRLINRLLQESDPAGVQAVLEENVEMVDDELLELMDLVYEDLVGEDRQEMAERLARIREQAEGLIA